MLASSLDDDAVGTLLHYQEFLHSGGSEAFLVRIQVDPDMTLL
ncbi:MAG: hypothetical protein ABGZ35_20620 [Planctomycetaceae bacterium]